MFSWLSKSQKRVAVVMLLLFITSIPWTSEAQGRLVRSTEPVDWCVAAGRWEFLAAMTAFGLGLIPGFQPIAIAYGVVALGFKGVQTVSCK